MLRRTLFVFLFFIFTTDLTYAAGILMRVQQMKAMKQQQAQMTQQQYAAYQEQQQQQGGAPGQPAAPVQPTYQQTVDQRNQAIAQAILNAHNQSVTSDSVPFGNDAQVNTAPTSPTTPAASQQQQALPQTGSAEVKDVVDLSEVWKKLDTRSTVWTLLIDDQAKALTVSEYINRFHRQGVKINEPPEHYVQMIDQIITQNPEMLDRPFGELVQIVAIVDYDFDNGMDKDALARKVLGEQGFEANKQRFTQQQPSGGGSAQ